MGQLSLIIYLAQSIVLLLHMQSNFSIILDRFKQNNNIAALLGKGKAQLPPQPRANQNPYEMDSEQMKEAEFLFNHPIAHSPVKHSSPLPIKESIQPKSILKESSMLQQQVPEKKDKVVSFYEEGPPIYLVEAEKRWKDKIEHQKKGKFQQHEHRLLCDAVGQFLACNQIQMNEFVSMISDKDTEKQLLRREKFFNILAGVLPNRSPMSCYKYIVRNFHKNNHQGPWSKQEVGQLLALVEKYGRKWKLIAKQMKRTSDNVYDKYRTLGEEALEERAKGLWKLSELVILLTQLQFHTKTKFLDPKIKETLADEEKHNKKEEDQFLKHKYNTKNFIFHNIEIVKRYLDVKQLKSINLQTVGWKKIVRHLPARTAIDCRNKMVQILQVLFRNNDDLDQLLIGYLQKQNVKEEVKLNWKTWPHPEFTPEEARNRFMILKKIIQGRSQKTFEVVLKEMRAKLDRQASVQKKK